MASHSALAACRRAFGRCRRSDVSDEGFECQRQRIDLLRPAAAVENAASFAAIAVVVIMGVFVGRRAVLMRRAVLVLDAFAVRFAGGVRMMPAAPQQRVRQQHGSGHESQRTLHGGTGGMETLVVLLRYRPSEPAHCTKSPRMAETLAGQPLAGGKQHPPSGRAAEWGPPQAGVVTIWVFI